MIMAQAVEAAIKAQRSVRAASSTGLTLYGHIKTAEQRTTIR